MGRVAKAFFQRVVDIFQLDLLFSSLTICRSFVRSFIHSFQVEKNENVCALPSSDSKTNNYGFVTLFSRFTSICAGGVARYLLKFFQRRL